MFEFLHPCRIMRISSCMNKSFNYFYEDVWVEYGLEESRKFPMFTHGPHRFFASLLLFLAFLHLFLEPVMKLRSKPFNFRPLLLVFNSCLFTINFIGFLVISCFVTDFGISLWTCKFKVDKYHEELMLKMGFIFMLTKIFELLRPVLYILRGHKPHKIDTFNQVLFLILVYQGFIFYPFGVYNWILFVDTLYYTLVYVYLIFSCTGPELRPTKYRAYLPLLNMLKFASMFSHSYITFPSECGGYFYFKVASVLYSSLGFILSTIYMIDKIDEHKRKQLKKSD